MPSALSPIFVVEDNEDDAFALRRVFKKLGIANPLQVVVDGQQAMDLLSAAVAAHPDDAHPLPCLVLLDLKLPYKDGFQVLEWIRLQPPLAGVVVVMLTGSEELRDQQRAYALGARSYLVKPAALEDVKRLLDSLESHWKHAGSRPVVTTTAGSPEAAEPRR